MGFGAYTRIPFIRPRDQITIMIEAQLRQMNVKCFLNQELWCLRGHVQLYPEWK